MRMTFAVWKNENTTRVTMATAYYHYDCYMLSLWL